MNEKNTTREHMRITFNKFRGSQAWASRELKVSRVTIGRYLTGHVVSQNLDATMPLLAEALERTDGKCINEVNGKSIRSQIRKIRRGKA